MAKLLSSTVQLRAILKNNGLKRGEYKISHRMNKYARSGKEYRDSYACLRKELLPEVIEKIVADGLTLHFNSKYPIFKW